MSTYRIVELKNDSSPVQYYVQKKRWWIFGWQTEGYAAGGGELGYTKTHWFVSFDLARAYILRRATSSSVRTIIVQYLDV